MVRVVLTEKMSDKDLKIDEQGGQGLSREKPWNSNRQMQNPRGNSVPVLFEQQQRRQLVWSRVNRKQGHRPDDKGLKCHFKN